MLKSLIIAFSTYSKIPMPRVEWNEKSMRYSMCFFPCVGAVIGCINLLFLYIFGATGIGSVTLTAVVLTVLPILITGGIHMDGFMDTVDARSSYKSMEDKLKILKDPHTGAFAIIFCVMYVLIYFGFTNETVSVFTAAHNTEGAVNHNICFQFFGNGITEANIVLALSFAYVRILSGLAVVLFRKAKRDGMAAATAQAADRKVKWILLVEWVVCAAAFISIDIICGVWYGTVAVLTGIISFLVYRNMAYKTFGGITGDLAGYFLQTTELAILIAVTIVQRGRMI